MDVQNTAKTWERCLGSVATVVVAICILVIGWGYSAGTLANMGPGYFPRLVGFLLLGLGSVCLILDIFGEDEGEPEGLHWRNISFVAAGVLAFAALIEPAGLVPATFLAVLLSIYADRAARPLDAMIYATLVTAAAWVLFIQVLGLPLVAIGRG